MPTNEISGWTFTQSEIDFIQRTRDIEYARQRYGLPPRNDSQNPEGDDMPAQTPLRLHWAIPRNMNMGRMMYEWIKDIVQDHADYHLGNLRRWVVVHLDVGVVESGRVMHRTPQHEPVRLDEPLGAVTPVSFTEREVRYYQLHISYRAENQDNGDVECLNFTHEADEFSAPQSVQDELRRIASGSTTPPPPAPEPSPALACACGRESGYVYDQENMCEDCYIERVRDSAGCSVCGSLNCEMRNVNARRFCPDCVSDNFDVCSCCGEIGDQGSMLRRGEIICRRCHNPEWAPGQFNPRRNTHRKVHKTLTYGVELETSYSPNYADLEGQTDWGCVREASTCGKEFISPILKGDKGLEEIADFISRWGESWEVDDSCGTHIHIGLQEYSLEECRKVAYAYRRAWPVLAKLVGPSRAHSGMCGSPRWGIGDLMAADDMHDFAGERDKFEYVNWRTLVRIGTVEIRVLPGTLDANLINTWIMWNCALVRKMAKLSWVKIEALWSNPDFSGRSDSADGVGPLNQGVT